jgi:hypothetical protein
VCRDLVEGEEEKALLTSKSIDELERLAAEVDRFAAHLVREFHSRNLLPGLLRHLQPSDAVSCLSLRRFCCLLADACGVSADWLFYR